MKIENFELWYKNIDVTFVDIEVTRHLCPYTEDDILRQYNKAASPSGMKERVALIDKAILKCMKL